MFSNVHDRVLTRLATAASAAQLLPYDAQPGADGCPLSVMLRAMPDDELEALAAIVAASPQPEDTTYRHFGAMSPYPPVRRLVEPSLGVRRSMTWDAQHADWLKTKIACVLRNIIDGAAFHTPARALEAETARRAA